MDIKVRYFASLRDKMGRDDESLSFDQSAVTIAEVWEKVSGGPIPDGVLVAVNMEYTDGAHEVANGDEVAFFPPVTGG